MSNLQEAINLLRAMTPIMDPEEDYLTIVALETKTAEAEEMRKKELEEAHAKLKVLARNRDAARKSCTRPVSALSSEEHAKFMNEHDAIRLQLVKKINEAESAQAIAEGELAKLKEEARNLEDRDPAVEHERELNGTTLRIRTYKGMGFESILDKDGNPSKMLVRAPSGDVHIVDLLDNTSTFVRANHLWKLASS